MVYSNVFCFLFYTEAYPASSSHIINSQFLTRSPVNRTRTLIKSQALLCAIQLHHKLNVLAHSRRQFTSVSSMDTFISCVYVLILCACLTAGGIRIRQEWEWQGFFFFLLQSDLSKFDRNCYLSCVYNSRTGEKGFCKDNFSKFYLWKQVKKKKRGKK